MIKRNLMIDETGNLLLASSHTKKFYTLKINLAKFQPCGRYRKKLLTFFPLSQLHTKKDMLLVPA